uniref:Uncharacterized protein n=1 Tax=Tanacetum cinerariifolium TaxID=118510 RepID=A0A6L2NZV8_TANCI|nr:hypothetical protein [Tanacetum cinerariifolium]
MVPYKAFACVCGAGDVVLSLGASSTLSYSLGHSTPPCYSTGPSTPQSFSSGPSRNAECSNCKLLLGKITVLKATVEMYMHPEKCTLTSAALLHEVYNDMRKLSLSFGISLGAPSTPSFSPGPSTPPSYSPRSSTPQRYSSGPSRNAERSNCKLLLASGKLIWMWIFSWKEEGVCLLTSSLGASSTLSYSPENSTPPSYSPRPSTPQSYSSRPSKNAEHSNCKLLLGKITVLKATVEMYMHPKQYTLTSAALLHEVYNDMRKLSLE